VLKEHNIEQVMLRNYCFDPTMAPPGKSVVVCIYPVEDFGFWEKLAADKKAYRAEKEKLAAAMADELERKYPGFKSAIEVTDVVTPMSYVHYTGNWKGTYMTWIIPPEREKEFRMLKKTVPGLDNFWLNSMWVQPPGGLPGGAMGGRHVIQLICHRDKKRFTASVPAAGR
jgi:phytoene dehydrogenase-like protein